MKKFLKRNGQAILKGLLLSVATIVVFELFHNAATMERAGIDAIGGEIFVFLIPFFAYLVMKRKEEKEAEDGN